MPPKPKKRSTPKKRAASKKKPARKKQSIPAGLAREYARKRVEIVRGLFAKGYSPKYGFGKLVEQICAQQGIPADSATVSVAVKRATEDLKTDPYIKFGKMRVLDVLGNELMELAQLKTTHPNQRIGKAKAMAKILDQIAEIEGVKAPQKHQVSVAAVIAQLPMDVMVAIEAAETHEQVVGILTKAVGPGQAEAVLEQLVNETDPAWEAGSG